MGFKIVRQKGSHAHLEHIIYKTRKITIPKMTIIDLATVETFPLYHLEKASTISDNPSKIKAGIPKMRKIPPNIKESQ